MACLAVLCIDVHCFALYCFALFCIRLNCIALHCIALLCIAVIGVALLRFALICFGLVGLRVAQRICFALHCSARQTRGVIVSQVMQNANVSGHWPAGDEVAVSVGAGDNRFASLRSALLCFALLCKLRRSRFNVTVCMDALMVLCRCFVFAFVCFALLLLRLLYSFALLCFALLCDAMN